MRSIAVFLLSIHLVGCCLVGQETAVVQESEYVAKEPARGVNPDAFFLVIGNQVIGPHNLRIEKVSDGRKKYPTGPDEYFVSANLGGIACRDRDEIYLFSKDHANNERVTHIQVKPKEYQGMDIDSKRVPDVKWAILGKLLARYKTTREIPEDVLEFMRAYNLFNRPMASNETEKSN